MCSIIRNLFEAFIIEVAWLGGFTFSNFKMDANEDNETMKRGNQTSYQHEYKLAAIKWFNKHEKNVSATAREFNVDRKRIREWVKNVETIKNMKTQSKRIGCGREPLYPVAETKLKNEFLEKKRRTCRS